MTNKGGNGSVDSKINRGSFVYFLKSSWKKIIAKKPNMKITRTQFRELTRVGLSLLIKSVIQIKAASPHSSS